SVAREPGRCGAVGELSQRIGYRKSFRTAPNTGGRGNAEYQDVLAGGKYLQTRTDVDANRVGIWGLSYGGVLTSQALTRNSDVFKAGVDTAGVHLRGSSLEQATCRTSRRRSPRSTRGSRPCCWCMETTIGTCSSRRRRGCAAAARARRAVRADHVS